MKRGIFALGLVFFNFTALSSCYAKDNTAMNYQFPNGVSLEFSQTDGNRLWAFAAKTPLFEPGKPIQFDSEYVCYQFDPSAGLLSERELGVGALRAAELDGNNGLALVVSGLRSENPESVLYLTNDSGKAWSATTKVPVAAVGAAFLAQNKIAIWSEKQVFVTEDWGRTWSRIQSAASALNFSRVKVPVASATVSGVPLVGIEYNKETRKTYSHLGVLTATGEFAEKLSLDGRVMDISRDSKGTLWILVFEEGEKPKSKVFAVENLLGGVRSHMIREIPESIPESVTSKDGTILILYAKWVVGSRMPLAAEEGTMLNSNESIKWRALDLDGLKLSKAVFSGKNGVWLYTKTDNRLSYKKWSD